MEGQFISLTGFDFQDLPSVWLLLSKGCERKRANKDSEDQVYRGGDPKTGSTGQSPLPQMMEKEPLERERERQVEKRGGGRLSLDSLLASRLFSLVASFQMSVFFPHPSPPLHPPQ